MDPLTHSVLGMACAMACVSDRKLRRPAALAGLGAGLLPDADIFLHSATDPLFNLEYHRHFTHSVLLAPLIALLAVFIAKALYRIFTRRPIPLRALFIPALVAALSHGFCDVWTSYGTRSWWPFSDARVTLDWISVIDPLLTLPLFLATLWALFQASRRSAVLGLVIVSFYLGLCVVQKSRAEAALQQWLVEQNLPTADRASVKPSFANIIVWRAMAVHGDQFRVVAVRCGWGTPKIIPGGQQSIYRTPAEAALALQIPPDSVQARDIARFAHFSDDWLGSVAGEPHTLGDLRYATMPYDIRPLWGIQLDPTHPDQPVKLRYFREVNREDLRQFWQFILGAQPSQS